MAEPPVDRDSSWFSDPAVLLGELQRGGVSARCMPVIAGYEDIRRLRRGGQGEVFSAFHKAMKRRVAIKVLSENVLSPQAGLRRFEREIDLVATLQHPNIVRVYDRGRTADGRYYFSMEYIEGVALDEYLAAQGGDRASPPRLRLVDLLTLFSRVCAAVSHAHQNGVIHRDLKPGNILIDARGEPRILDFGLAKHIGSETGAEAAVTRTGEFAGTLSYASPEQVTGDSARIDVRSDIFSLGVVLYEMLTGRRPFPPSTSLADIIKALTEVDPPPPSKCLASPGDGPVARWRCADRLNDEIDTITLRALAKEPARRYQSAAALRDDIRRYLRGEPIEAKREHTWYLLKKALPRYKAAAGVSVLIVALVIGFSVAMTVLYRRARAEADKANQIKHFLEDTLGSVGPPAEGHDVTVAEALDEAVHWIDLALARQPEVAASLRNTVGNSYRNLGRYDEAETQLLAALGTRRRLLGDEHADVAQSLNALALLRRDQGRYAEAQRLLERALSMRRRLLGDEHLDVAMSLQNLAVLSRRQGRFDKAWRLFEESRGIRRRVLGDDHPAVAMCEYQMGNLAEERGDAENARRLHQAALRKRRLGLSPRHPDIARSLLALGSLLMRDGALEEADSHLRECVSILREIHPKQHWRVAEAESMLGECLSRSRRFDAAEPLLLRSYENLKAHWGPGHPRTVAALRRLIALYEASGAPEKAEELRSLLPSANAKDRRAAIGRNPTVAQASRLCLHRRDAGVCRFLRKARRFLT